MAGAVLIGRPGLGLPARFLVASIPCVLAVFVGTRYLGVMEGSTTSPPFNDAVTYQAAGERLNAGHDLYRLGPGDRPVYSAPDISSAPLLSPPPIAVLWRPIAAVPWGFATWVVACWVALLGTTFYLVLGTGIRGAVFATVLAPGIGEALAACNVAAFFPLMLVLAWRQRDGAGAGVLVGSMASFKIAPIALGGWLVGTRRWAAVAATVATVAAVLIVSLIGSSPAAFADYVTVTTTSGESGQSPLGLAWLSPVVLVGGSLLALGLGRWPRVSFIVAVTASVLGAPASYPPAFLIPVRFVTLLALMAPFMRPSMTPGGRRRRAGVG